jgi:hypothetical protein
MIIIFEEIEEVWGGVQLLKTYTKAHDVQVDVDRRSFFNETSLKETCNMCICMKKIGIILKTAEIVII